MARNEQISVSAQQHSLDTHGTPEHLGTQRLYLGCQIARPWPQRTPQWLQRDCIDSTLDHPEAQVVQARERGVAIERRRRSCPEHLRRACGARPDDSVYILRRRLFGPQELLAYKQSDGRTCAPQAARTYRRGQGAPGTQRCSRAGRRYMTRSKARNTKQIRFRMCAEEQISRTYVLPCLEGIAPTVPIRICPDPLPGSAVLFDRHS